MFSRHRRSGHRIVLIAALFAFFLIAYQKGLKTPIRSLRQPALYALGPVQRVVFAITDGIDCCFKRYVYLVNLTEELERMKEASREYEGLQTELNRLRIENRRLREIAGFIALHGVNAKAARVIRYQPNMFSQGIMIDLGSEDGVKSSMGVITPKGVVGQITAISRHESTVSLVRNELIGIAARTVQGQAPGTVHGTNGMMLEMRQIPAHDEVKIGDTVVTSGQGRIFPEGQIVGHIVEVRPDSNRLFQKATVQPFVKFDRLAEVLVVESDFENRRMAEDIEAPTDGA